MLLDLGLPGEDGFSIARRLREHWQCGLVIVTGRGDAVDKVVGLEVGADDYVTKPFDLRELLARDQGGAAAHPTLAARRRGGARRRHGRHALLRRLAARHGGAPLHDAARQRGRADRGEFDLLCAFAQHPGRVLSRDFLLETTRGRDAGPFDRTIDVQVGRLRKKLEPDADRRRRSSSRCAAPATSSSPPCAPA